MNTVYAMSDENNIIVNVSKEIEYIICHMTIPKFCISMNWRFIRLMWNISVIINAARLMLLQGSDSCNIPMPIIKQYCKVIHDICNNLVLIHNRTSESIFLFPIKKILDTVLPDWLELAEDFAVSSDDEIRHLLGQIADAV